MFISSIAFLFSLFRICSVSSDDIKRNPIDIKKKPNALSRIGLFIFFELFWEKWVVMDSNHRRHSQQIYSLPHLATLVTTQTLCS